jgi:hypothetical protein
VKPIVRKQEIEKNRAALNLHHGGRDNPVLHSLGITIEQQPVQVQPSLSFSQFALITIDGVGAPVPAPVPK